MVEAPILNQWSSGECSGYAILWALIRMKPDIDYKAIEKRLIEEDWNSFTFFIAYKWFIKEWYIRWVRKVKYSPFLAKRTPIITGVTNTDWKATGSPPYVLKFENRQTLGSHFICIVWPWKVANSWGS